MISNIKISDEILERAAKTIFEDRQFPNWRVPTWEEIGEEDQGFFLLDARSALEEAIPSIAVQVLEEMAKILSGSGPDELTYVSAIVAEIREQAKQIQRRVR